MNGLFDIQDRVIAVTGATGVLAGGACGVSGAEHGKASGRDGGGLRDLGSV